MWLSHFVLFDSESDHRTTRKALIQRQDILADFLVALDGRDVPVELPQAARQDR